MNSRAKKVLEDALELPDPDRAELAAELIASLDPGADQGLGQAWDTEIGRRISEVDSGEVATVAWPKARELIVGHSDDPADH